MAEITTKVCSVAFESFFKKAVLFNEAGCDVVARKCLEAFAGYGLMPPQIGVRAGDQTFNYELSFSLFNGNGIFRISAEKVQVNFENAVNDKDLEIVRDCIAKFYEHVPLPGIKSTLISATAHATFVSAEEWTRYIEKYSNPSKQIVCGGVIGYFRGTIWKEEIRLAIDKSSAFPTGLFLAWSTVFQNGKPTGEVLKSVKEAFVESATKFDLAFPKNVQL